MRITIRYGQYDVEAKADSAPTVTDIQAWADITDLTKDRIAPPNAMTMEDTYIPLDGTMKYFPSNPVQSDWGWFSQSMSDGNCLFAAPPTINIAFTRDHRSPGITLKFYPYTNDYAREVRCTWYNSSGTVIHIGTYILNGTSGVINESVDAYRRVKIELIRTTYPYRYIKLYAIEYGIESEFTDRDIDQVNILEEIDPISDTLSINTLNFNVKMKDPVFSLISGDVSDNMLMKKQMMTVTANDDVFGVFFLDEWEDSTGKGIDFSFDAVDAIGIMDSYNAKFMGGLYTNEPAENIIAQIFSLAFPTNLIVYELDDALKAATLTGWMPISTLREALQHICFTIGATVDTSRRDTVWIYKRDTDVTYNIPLLEQYNGRGKIKPTDYYSGVDIDAYNYTASTETVTAQNGVLPSGQHRITFSRPLRSLTITGGTIVASGVNYADISVATERSVVLSGNGYAENKTTYSVRDTLAAGEVEAIAEFTGATLINNAIAQARAQDIFNYLKNRVQASPEVRLQDKEIGYVAEVETFKKPLVGTIESLDIDLRGNRARSRIVGNIKED